MSYFLQNTCLYLCAFICIFLYIYIYLFPNRFISLIQYINKYVYNYMNIATTIYLFISPTLPYFSLYGFHLWLIPLFNPYLSISSF